MAMKLMLEPDAKTVTGAAGGGAAAVPAAAPAAAPVTPAPAAAAPAKPAEEAKPSFLAAPEAKKEEPAKPAAEPKKDEPWALKLPEGVKLAAEQLTAFEAEMKAAGLDQTAAQKLLERDLAKQKVQYESTVKSLKDQSQQWYGELKSRWGDKFAENDAALKRVYDHGDPTGEFRAKLAASELQYSPDLIRFLERYIPLFADPKLNPPSKVGVTSEDTRTVREKLTADYEARMKAMR